MVEYVPLLPTVNVADHPCRQQQNHNMLLILWISICIRLSLNKNPCLFSEYPCTSTKILKNQFPVLQGMIGSTSGKTTTDIGVLVPILADDAWTCILTQRTSPSNPQQGDLLSWWKPDPEDKISRDRTTRSQGRAKT